MFASVYAWQFMRCERLCVTNFVYWMPVLECVCVFFLCVSLFLSMSSCPSACSHDSSMCLDMCVCILRGGRKVSKVPRRNNEGKWIPDGLFFLFSLCCQWREGSDKPLTGNRLAHSGFELCRQHRATESSLSPPQDSITLFPTTIALN